MVSGSIKKHYLNWLCQHLPFLNIFFQQSLPTGKVWGYPTLLISWFINFNNFICWLFFRRNRPEVFLGKGILNICSKFTGDHPCRSVISIKLLCNFIEILLRHGSSLVNLTHVFRAPFPRNTCGWLLLIFLQIAFLRGWLMNIFHPRFDSQFCVRHNLQSFRVLKCARLITWVMMSNTIHVLWKKCLC